MLIKIIIDSDMITKIFNTDYPDVPEVLNNRIIKKMIRGCEVKGVYKDEDNAEDFGNIVIKLIPSLTEKGKKRRGK